MQAETHYRKGRAEVEAAAVLRRTMRDAIGCGEATDEELVANVRHIAESFRTQKAPSGLNDMRMQIAKLAAEGLVRDNQQALLTIHHMVLGVSDGR